MDYFKTTLWAAAVEYGDCTSSEGLDPTPRRVSIQRLET